MGRPLDNNTSTFHVSRGRATTDARTFITTQMTKNIQFDGPNSLHCDCRQFNNQEFTSGIEDSLETQARASLSLFGFGSSNDACINWKPLGINANEMKMNVGNKSQLISLRERTCSLGKNAFYWNLLSKSHPKNLTEENNDSNGNVHPECEETDDEEHEFEEGKISSKLVQQYLVKSSILIPASVQEIARLIIQSDPSDMNITMQYLVGVKVIESEMVYSRNEKRSPYPARTRYGMFKPQPPEPTEPNNNHLPINQNLDHKPIKPDPNSIPKSNEFAAQRIQRRRQLLRESSSLLQDDDILSGNHGNLSLKWVLAEKTGRMFTTRVQHCLLDYDCVVVNDWDAQDDCGPMFVRVMQSTYLPQFQSKTQTDAGVRLADLQPTGIMVREAKNSPGFAEVQFVGSILEKADFPVSFRRARLRALCLKIAKLEEIIRGRHLSQSLMIQQQPLWVRNTDRMSCNSCDMKFSLSRRRHHCRLCGDICCSECCPKVVVELPDAGPTHVRICVLCMKRRRTRETTGSTSSSSSSTGSPSKNQAESISSPCRSYAYPPGFLNEAYV
uniref:Uncharacterized protein AlNc14C252G9662 n=1 Tax=Albugo laibachii Nc14 TaxID=890382 RepID=F0WTI2_9STRA|nr:conserved hypothetical protein [Albugo laibachii Nc14]|eukprot:CCA24673.1 conserved hypothetical protein [Albugo laibachii Nc14]